MNEAVYNTEMNKGHSAAWDQNWAEAAEHYRTALAEGLSDQRALTSLGLAYFELQDYNTALEIYKRAAKIAPEDPLPPEKIAEITQHMGDLNTSIEHSLRAAELHLQKRDAEKAIENWTRITRLEPEHLGAHSRLAVIHERLGRIPQAVTEYLAVTSLLQAAGKADQATQTVNMALKLMPENDKALQAADMLRAGQQIPKPARAPAATGPLRTVIIVKRFLDGATWLIRMFATV